MNILEETKLARKYITIHRRFPIGSEERNLSDALENILDRLEYHMEVAVEEALKKGDI